MSKIKNNAIASVQGITYQNLVALEKCFELLESQTLYIEIYGDLTIKGESQIEVKNVQENLTDTNINFWKTLNNWVDEKFDIEPYSTLILYTTQKIGPNSSLRLFNSNDIQGKIKIVENIKEKFFSKNGRKNEDIQKFMEYIFESSRREKLEFVLSKFILVSATEDYSKIYKRLCDTWGSHLSIGKQEQYIKSLIGFITNNISLNLGEINYYDFKTEKEKASQQLTPNRMIFPKTFANYKPTEEERNSALSYSFVKKIEEIEYYDDVGIDAVTNYYQAKKTLHKEISNYEDVELSNYEDELKHVFNIKHRRLSRKASIDNIIDQSKDFYDEFFESEPPVFNNFVSIPRFFRDGWLHMLVDEDNNISWKLKVKK